MRRTALLLCAVALAACDSGRDVLDSGSFSALVNGKRLAFADAISVRGAEAVVLSAEHCVPNRTPRNLSITFLIPETPRVGTYSLSQSVSPLSGETSVFVTELDGDAIEAKYRLAGSGAVTFDVSGERLRGRFSGLFVVEEEDGESPFRYFPDTLNIEGGTFDVSLIPSEEYPGRYAPCDD